MTRDAEPKNRVGYRAVIETRQSLRPYAGSEEYIRWEPTTAQKHALRRAYSVVGKDCVEALQSVPPVSRAQLGHRNLLVELTKQ